MGRRYRHSKSNEMSGAKDSYLEHYGVCSDWGGKVDYSTDEMNSNEETGDYDYNGDNDGENGKVYDRRGRSRSGRSRKRYSRSGKLRNMLKQSRRRPSDHLEDSYYSAESQFQDRPLSPPSTQPSSQPSSKPSSQPHCHPAYQQPPAHPHVIPTPRPSFSPTFNIVNGNLSPRADFWIAICFSSCVTIANLVLGSSPALGVGSGIDAPGARSAVEQWSIAGCSLSIVLSFFVSCAFRYGPSRIWLTHLSGNDIGYSVGDESGQPVVRKHPVRRKGFFPWSVTMEFYAAIFSVLIWSLVAGWVLDFNNGLAVTSHSVSDNWTTAFGSNIDGRHEHVVIWNTNLFFSTWVSFGISAYIFADIATLLLFHGGGSLSSRVRNEEERLRPFRAAGAVPLHHRPPNVLSRSWALQIFSSSLLLGFSSVLFLGVPCQGNDSTYCQHNTLGILFGTLGLVCSGGYFLLAAVERSHRRQGTDDYFTLQNLGYVHALFVVISFVCSSINAAFVTGIEGPGHESNNLFFVSWSHFALSLYTSMKCWDGYLVSLARENLAADDASHGSHVLPMDYLESSPPMVNYQDDDQNHRAKYMKRLSSMGSTTVSSATSMQSENIHAEDDEEGASDHPNPALGPSIQSLITDDNSSEPILYCDNTVEVSEMGFDVNSQPSLPSVSPYPLYQPAVQYGVTTQRDPKPNVSGNVESNAGGKSAMDASGFKYVPTKTSANEPLPLDPSISGATKPDASATAPPSKKPLKSAMRRSSSGTGQSRSPGPSRSPSPGYARSNRSGSDRSKSPGNLSRLGDSVHPQTNGRSRRSSILSLISIDCKEQAAFSSSEDELKKTDRKERQTIHPGDDWYQQMTGTARKTRRYSRRSTLSTSAHSVDAEAIHASEIPQDDEIIVTRSTKRWNSAPRAGRTSEASNVARYLPRRTTTGSRQISNTNEIGRGKDVSPAMAPLQEKQRAKQPTPSEGGCTKGTRASSRCHDLDQTIRSRNFEDSIQGDRVEECKDPSVRTNAHSITTESHEVTEATKSKSSRSSSNKRRNRSTSRSVSRGKDTSRREASQQEMKSLQEASVNVNPKSTKRSVPRNSLKKESGHRDILVTESDASKSSSIQKRARSKSRSISRGKESSGRQKCQNICQSIEGAHISERSTKTTRSTSHTSGSRRRSNRRYSDDVPLTESEGSSGSTGRGPPTIEGNLLDKSLRRSMPELLASHETFESNSINDSRPLKEIHSSSSGSSPISEPTFDGMHHEEHFLLKNLLAYKMSEDSESTRDQSSSEKSQSTTGKKSLHNSSMTCSHTDANFDQNAVDDMVMAALKQASQARIALQARSPSLYQSQYSKSHSSHSRETTENSKKSLESNHLKSFQNSGNTGSVSGYSHYSIGEASTEYGDSVHYAC